MPSRTILIPLHLPNRSVVKLVRKKKRASCTILNRLSVLQVSVEELVRRKIGGFIREGENAILHHSNPSALA